MGGEGIGEGRRIGILGMVSEEPEGYLWVVQHVRGIGEEDVRGCGANEGVEGGEV